MLKPANLIKFIKFGVYLAMLTPLVYIPQVIFGAIFGKMIYFQIIIELALPFFLYLIIFHKNYRPRFSGLTKVILIFFAALFLSSILGVDFIRSFWGSPERMRGLFALLHFLFFYFYIITAFQTDRDKKKLFIMAIIVGLAVAVYGVLERINPSWSIDKVSIKGTSGHRVMSTSGNPIFLAGYMLFVFFLSFYHLLSDKDRTKWIGLGGMAFSALVLLFTGTRGALIGLIAGSVIFLALLFFTIGKKQKIIIGIFSLIALVVISLALFSDIPGIRKNKYWDFSRITDFSFKNVDGSVAGRFLLWDLSLRAFKEKPLLGWGVENFDYAFDKYYNPQFFRGGINETWSDRAHNEFLDFLVMGGIIGFAAYVLIFIFLARQLCRRENFKKQNFVFLAAFGAFAVHSFFEVDDPSTTLMFFFSLAIIYQIIKDPKNNRSLENNSHGTGSPVILLLLGAVVLFCIYFFNIKPLYAGINYISFKNAAEVSQKKMFAENFLFQNTPYSDEFRFRFANESFIDVGNISDPDYKEWALQKSDEAMQAVILRHPGDYSYFHALGNIFLREGSLDNNTELLDRAIGLYLKALEISPKRQATMFQLATTYILRGRANEAVVLLKKAVSDDDKIGQSHWRLAVAFLANGQKEEARISFKEALRLSFVSAMVNEMQNAVGLCAEVGDYSCVVDIYEKFIDRNGANADLFAQMAAAYAAAGRYEEARGAVAKAVELDPSLEAEARVFLKQIGY